MVMRTFYQGEKNSTRRYTFYDVELIKVYSIIVQKACKL